ncbi:DUF2321 domain-containing protein [Natronorubrum thiooxidans]|uniref:Uncharacterized protein n=1 Tax=Natronorubrum thiooxidans TaxID=308853 RepID=A0A1N7DNY2_9EURY|nr:DUF2321 domain-containing protein [Natronorubrum thiooxidans]SIR77471.1 hypothetical protein SAMN05421752_102404 [Natronorubrum thiooxidans]
MTDYYLAICASGHLIDSDEVTVTEQINKDSFMQKQYPRQNYNVSYDFCPDCGAEVLTSCPECNSNLQIEYHGPPYPEENHIPSFCYSCGKSFPWTATVEAEKQREGNFLDIDDSEIDGHFYPNFVYEINLCYKVKADQAVLVLN